MLDGAGLSTEAMQRFAHWTNLSETTFVLPPEARTPTTACASSLRAASCPSPGIRRSAPATRGWRPAARRAATDVIVQECGAGLVPVRRTRRRAGVRRAAAAALGPGRGRARRARSPGCSASTRGAIVGRRSGSTTARAGSRSCSTSAEAVLALAPRFGELDVGVVGAAPAGAPEAFEVRAFFPKDGAHRRGPGHRQPQRLARPVAARHAAARPRRTSPARARRSAAPAASTSAQDDDGAVWVGGGTVTCVRGEVEL